MSTEKGAPKLRADQESILLLKAILAGKIVGRRRCMAILNDANRELVRLHREIERLGDLGDRVQEFVETVWPSRRKRKAAEDEEQT